MDNSISDEMKRILARLTALSQMDIPQYRSYRRPDGSWADREPVPEYREREELIRRWHELHALELALAPHPSRLLTSLRLERLHNSLLDDPLPMERAVRGRFAASVSRNPPESIS